MATLSSDMPTAVSPCSASSRSISAAGQGRRSAINGQRPVHHRGGGDGVLGRLVSLAQTWRTRSR